MSSPFQDHSCFCLLNKVGQHFGEYGIKGHFKLRIRYFDAKIRPFLSVKYTLLLQILVFRMNLRGIVFGCNGFS